MKHLTINDYGSFLGLRSGNLVVKQGDDKKNFPLNRLSSILVAKKGVTISSDLIEALSLRGIKLFFLSGRGAAPTALVSQSQHGVVAVRMAQYDFCKTERQLKLAIQFVTGKIKNQRAVINYFSKYHKHDILTGTSEKLLVHAAKAKNAKNNEKLLGFEGASAAAYFNALTKAELFSSSFSGREGRGSKEINNAMMNYGYAILRSRVFSAVINAGLEPYIGVLHGTRPGKRSLVLDIMEEYRAWVVDRIVIKLRKQSEGKNELDKSLRGALSSEIQKTCAKRYNYRGKRIKLEHIIQRQVYRLCGHFCGEKNYKPYLFKW